MKAYEDHLYEEWKTRVELMLPSLLKRNLLIKPSDKLAQGEMESKNTPDDHEEHGEF